MKQFFKFFFASMLGFIVGNLILLFLLLGIFAAALSMSKETVVVKPNSVLYLKFDKPISDRSPKNPLATIDFSGFKPSPGLNEIIRNIEKASSDPNIKGICIEPFTTPAGFTTLSEIRKALMKFKESGKFMISYSDFYSQGTYYLASVSDKIYMNPEGEMELKGLASQPVFLKGLLKKLEIEPQLVKYGKYKSAAEPLMLDKLSAENRLQISAYINELWKEMIQEIASSRGLSTAQLNEFAEKFILNSAVSALENNLLDGLWYKDQVLAELRLKLGLEENAKINFIELDKYVNAVVSKEGKKISRDKIAVVYAQGSIIMGDGDEQTIGSEGISKALRKAREDKNVKAIVLRVNSGGGSALASEVILREVLLAKETKPVIASMGDVAASGGYYISCGATKIIANPSTLTGSIGVIGVIPNMQKFFNNKLGITFDEVKTNQYADFIPFNRPMRPDEEKIMMKMIDRIYKAFITHVAKGRNMTPEAVDEIGQGRIWTGVDAKNIGLIDEFGGLDAAIKLAAELAGIEDYRLTELPEQKDFLTQIMEDFQGGSIKRAIRTELGDDYKYYQYLKNASSFIGIQARIPFEIEVF